MGRNDLWQQNSGADGELAKCKNQPVFSGKSLKMAGFIMDWRQAIDFKRA